ncbi:DEAD/DEAH box helicase family protein [Barrientosiimonas marina]|uniref:EcoAI/FtnUII family type I restriction enzme subunit R n=1 Tax=Lentibacillus kimchii TaxID=1542911 RepID=A0ABW2UUL5_9BACI
MDISLSERDICTKYITPAVEQAGWNRHRQMREEVSFTDGRIIPKGKSYTRKKGKRADYILYYKPNIPLALIEAKDAAHSVGSGMQQALDYAEILDIPFVYSSNGRGFLEHDRTGTGELVTRELTLDQFPSPETLWQRYRTGQGFTDEEEQIVTQGYLTGPDKKPPRYYQRIAINRTVEAVAKGQDRILLVSATGTGKTMIAFHIIHRLWKSGAKKRILFLADRNILVDQAKNNDFRDFGDKMTKIQNHEVNKSYEIYLALYQGVSGAEDWKNIYKEFSPTFFDLIVIDECHRGSARDDSAWREILNYFDQATHIGMTATPKETEDVSNMDYFGKPIYTYSLKQGIDDGFLAPYRVVRYLFDRDVEGWRPHKGEKDRNGEVIEDRMYNRKDFDKGLVLTERTKQVAKQVSDYMKHTDRYQKAIIFCVNIDHAERMQQALMNENQDLVNENSKYVMCITGDKDEGKMELDNFIHPEETYPVIATTSKLMTTGVDAQTCKLIVLDSNINSITEFKQIIGRGTRINEEYGKHSFTIMDFRGVTDLFADPDFDGEPVQVYQPNDGESPVPPDDTDIPSEQIGESLGDYDIPDDTPPDISINGNDDYDVKTYYVDNVQVNVLSEKVQYYNEEGKLVTESLKDYTKNTVQDNYRTMDEFLNQWQASEQKEAIIEELLDQGVLLDELERTVGRDYDPFDLIMHVAFDQKPLTRQERVRNVKKQDYFTQYGEQARAVLEKLLDKYADEGIENIESMDVLKLDDFSEHGSVMEIIKQFGGKSQYQVAVQELEQAIYAEV